VYNYGNNSLISYYGEKKSNITGNAFIRLDTPIIRQDAIVKRQCVFCWSFFIATIF